jgi:putative PIN family toxin of toxin-antitoxin system
MTQATAVLDTNIVLDLCVFADPDTQALHAAVHGAVLQWIATPTMRDELERVLAYPHIAARLTQQQRSAQAVLAQFDLLAVLQPVAAKAPVTCKDPDDQKFIDLAVAHHALLLSKDKAVWCMAKRLAKFGVGVGRRWVPLAD